MDKDLKLVTERWITGAAPESAHPADMRRFYDIIFQCIKNDDRVNSEELANLIKENLQWTDEKIEEFSTDKAILADDIVGFVQYLKSQKGINVIDLI